MSDIQAIIMDIGGVVLATHEDRTAAAVAKTSSFSVAEIVERVHYSSDMAQKLDVGAWTLREGYDFLCRMLRLSMSYEDFLAAWMSMLGEDFPEVRSALEALPRSLSIYTLSNTNKEHLEVLARHWLHDISKEFFVSCEIGLRKPDRDIFEYVLGRIGVPAEQVLFFDDKQANVDAAGSLGIRSVLVSSPSIVPQTLRALGLLPGNGSPP